MSPMSSRYSCQPSPQTRWQRLSTRSWTPGGQTRASGPLGTKCRCRRYGGRPSTWSPWKWVRNRTSMAPGSMPRRCMGGRRGAPASSRMRPSTTTAPLYRSREKAAPVPRKAIFIGRQRSPKRECPRGRDLPVEVDVLDRRSAGPYSATMPSDVHGGAAAPSGRVLDPGFFARDTLDVAADLLVKLVVREVDGRARWGRLVEVEAYCGPADRAAHSWRGLTPRTTVMYGPPGHVYVYLIYGMHHCLNFVTRPAGCPQAVLVRALEPGPGVGRASGPGLVCRALAIDRTLNGRPLVPPDLYVADDGLRVDPAAVVTGPRVGVAYAGDGGDRPGRFRVKVPAPAAASRHRPS